VTRRIHLNYRPGKMSTEQHPSLAELFAECQRLRGQSEAIARRMAELSQEIERVARNTRLAGLEDHEQFVVSPLPIPPQPPHPWDTLLEEAGETGYEGADRSR